MAPVLHFLSGCLYIFAYFLLGFIITVVASALDSITPVREESKHAVFFTLGCFSLIAMVSVPVILSVSARYHHSLRWWRFCIQHHVFDWFTASVGVLIFGLFAVVLIIGARHNAKRKAVLAKRTAAREARGIRNAPKFEAAALLGMLQPGRYYLGNNRSIVVDEEKQAWLLSGLPHREDGAALEYRNGKRYWYRNGRLHREDGPAVIDTDGEQQWWVNGKQHRDDGPAVLPGNNGGRRQWWLNGEQVKKFTA